MVFLFVSLNVGGRKNPEGMYVERKKTAIFAALQIFLSRGNTAEMQGCPLFFEFML